MRIQTLRPRRGGHLCGMEHATIKNWSADDRPREKLLRHGSRHLSNAELLALLINKGTREKSAVDLGRSILTMVKHSLPELGKLSPRDLMRVKGIGKAKAIAIAAALELGRRRLDEPALEKLQIAGSHDIAEFLKAKLKDYQHEVFAVLFLNRANKVNHFEIISEGGMTQTIADPRVILRKAIIENAVSIVLCHNHPSGSLKASRADELLTEKIREAASYMDIKVLDHIIVSEHGYFSFADEGLI